MTDCCDDYRCTRRQPILIVQGPASGRWCALTQYYHDSDDLLVVVDKHALTGEQQDEINTMNNKARVLDELLQDLDQTGDVQLFSTASEIAAMTRANLERYQARMKVE